MSDDMDYPNIHVTMDRKVNLGNYESASVSVGLSRVPVGATAEQIDQMLETAGLAYKRLAAHLNAKVDAAKKAGGYFTDDEIAESSKQADENLKTAHDELAPGIAAAVAEAFAGRS